MLYGWLPKSAEKNFLCKQYTLEVHCLCVRMTVQISDSAVLVCSVIVAVVGLVLLALARPPPESQQYILQGTVVQVRGSHATVTANVTYIGKNVSVGPINQTVFWGGTAFIAAK